MVVAPAIHKNAGIQKIISELGTSGAWGNWDIMWIKSKAKNDKPCQNGQ